MTTVWEDLLARDGIPWSVDQGERLRRHLDLLRGMNDYASLVSIGDLARLEAVHVPDSLSLAGWVRRVADAGHPHLDIGSGGGFPAIPLAVALPGVPMVLVERSVKKVGFLRQALGALGLGQVRLVQGEFPAAVAGMRFGSVTARAVERPGAVLKALRPLLRDGAVFLGQTGLPEGVDRAAFHVEQIEDAWTASGLRRGTLHLIRSAAEGASPVPRGTSCG